MYLLHLGVMPDSETEIMMVNVFGMNAFPLRKLRRMAYWMPKFKNLSPWPVPDPLPDNGLEIAKLAIERIMSVDHQSKISVHYVSFLELVIFLNFQALINVYFSLWKN